MRTIVAGIALSYPVADLPGFHCLVVVNLAPRKLMGIESHGMLLAAERTLPATPTGMVALAKCLGASPGARIG